MENQNLVLGTPKQKNVGESRIAKFAEILQQSNPNWVDMEIEGYTVIGKLDFTGSRHLLEQDGNYFYATIKDATAVPPSFNGPTFEPREVKIDIVKMGNIKYDPSLFVPMVSKTPMDGIFSKKGGIMPATNYITVGDPGIGKSTLSVEHAAQLQIANPDLKVLFISGEMTRVDLAEYLERFEAWKQLDTVFVSEFEEGTYKETFEQLFDKGWDFIVGDSFAEIVEAVKEDYNMYTNGKMGSNGAEKWLIDQMVKHNLGDNQLKKYTAFNFIQQVTKGGKFVGSNKLKHNTTGMIELRYTKSGDRKIDVTKNRRGTQYGNLDLHFDFPEHPKEGEAPVFFDMARLEREREVFDKINSEREQLLRDEKTLDALFGQNSGEEEVEDDLEVMEEAE